MGEGPGISDQCRKQVTCVAFVYPFVADPRPGQPNVLLSAGKKRPGLGNKNRLVFRPFVLGTSCHSH